MIKLLTVLLFTTSFLSRANAQTTETLRLYNFTYESQTLELMLSDTEYSRLKDDFEDVEGRNSLRFVNKNTPTWEDTVEHKETWDEINLLRQFNKEDYELLLKSKLMRKIKKCSKSIKYSSSSFECEFNLDKKYDKGTLSFYLIKNYPGKYNKKVNEYMHEVVVQKDQFRVIGKVSRHSRTQPKKWDYFAPPIIDKKIVLYY